MSSRAATRQAGLPGVAWPAGPFGLSGRIAAGRRAADEGHWVFVFGLAGVVLMLLFAALAFSRLDDASRGVDAIGREAIPSIDAADQAASLLSGMDAQSIDNALAGPGGSQAARRAFLETRGRVDEQVRGMLRTSQPGSADDQSIGGLQAALHEYDVREGLHTAETRLGFPLGAAQQRAASALIDTAAIPGALAVDDAKTTFLGDEYARRQDGATWGRLAVVVGLLLVVGVLIAGQRFLARTYHRLLNRPLVAATLLVLVFAQLTLGALGAVADDLRQMAPEAHGSIHALQLARVELEHARRDQSLFLLEPGHGARYEQEYAVQVGRAFCVRANAAAGGDTVVCQPLTTRVVQQVADQLRRGRSTAFSAAFSGRPPGSLDARYTGYLADALRNVSAGSRELDADLAVLTSLVTFEQVDGQMRDLDRGNQHAEAIALNTGTGQGQGGWAFDRVESSLQSAIDQNRSRYANALSDASGRLALARAAAPLVGLVGVVLIWFGVQPTLARYRLSA